MKKIGMITLGCRVNQYESQAIAEELEKMGYTIVPPQDECDVYIINTCTVTASSDKKSRQMIGRALARKKQNSSIIVCAIGCYTQNKFQNNQRISVNGFENIDLIGGNTDKSKIPLLLHEYITSESQSQLNILRDIDIESKFEKLSLTKSTNTRAYLKVQDGCNNFCTYCIVPVVRGRVRSKPPEDVKIDLINLKKAGYNEVVFCGIEISAYESGLEKLAISAKESGFERVRFGSLNPTTFDEEFVKKLSQIDIVMPHFHLSVQSASDNVLKNMGRGYDSCALNRSVELIGKYFRNATLSCDIICGFPGETDADFEATKMFVANNEITHAHIFPYSKREGTPAATYAAQIAEMTKKERCAELQKIADEKAKSILKRYVGSEFKVLIENKKGGYCFGHTENFLPVALCHECDVGSFEHVVLEDRFSTISDEFSFVVQ